jgi:hypothetical protein
LALASIYTTDLFGAKPNAAKSSPGQVVSTTLKSLAAIRVLWGMDAAPGVPNPAGAVYPLPERVVYKQDEGYISADDYSLAFSLVMPPGRN